jgi:hypothetical protein
VAGLAVRPSFALRTEYKMMGSSKHETDIEGEWMVALDHVGFAVADYSGARRSTRKRSRRSG